MLFGDLLGDHQLLTAVYVSSQLDESALGALSVNRKARLNWAQSFDQTPDLRLRHIDSSLNTDRERHHSHTRAAAVDQPPPGRFRGVSAEPLAARRAQRRVPSNWIRARTVDRSAVDAHRHGRRTRHRAASSEPSVGVADAGIALIGDDDLRRHRADRYRFADGQCGRPHLHERPRRLPALRDAVRPYTLAIRLVHLGRYGEDAGDFRLRDSYVGSST